MQVFIAKLLVASNVSQRKRFLNNEIATNMGTVFKVTIIAWTSCVIYIIAIESLLAVVFARRMDDQTEVLCLLPVFAWSLNTSSSRSKVHNCVRRFSCGVENVTVVAIQKPSAKSIGNTQVPGLLAVKYAVVKMNLGNCHDWSQSLMSSNDFLSCTQCCRFGVVEALFVARTKLFYVEPG